jgi:hypothetical protein
MSDELQRWLDSEIPGELRRVLRSADADRPHDAQLAHLQAKLESALGPTFGRAPEATDTHARASSAGSPAAIGGAAVGSALAIVGALMVGLAALWYAQQPQPPSVQTSAAALPASKDLPPTPALAPVVAPTPQPSAAAPTLPLQPSAAAPPAARSPRAGPQSGGLMEELKQLEAIRRRLAKQPAQALAAIGQHARRFPQGALGPERELLRIEALQRLGRSAEAQQAAETALSGNHPYALQIRQLMAAGEH